MVTALDALLTQTSDTCGGRIRINGTRITVSRVATLYKQGMTAEDIATTYSHLSLGQVYAALAYYHANQQTIEAEMSQADAIYDSLSGDSDAEGHEA